MNIVTENLHATDIAALHINDNPWGFDAKTKQVLDQIRLTSNPHEVLFDGNVYTFRSVMSLYETINGISLIYWEKFAVEDIFIGSADCRPANEEDLNSAMTIYEALMNAIKQRKYGECSYAGQVLSMDLAEQLADVMHCNNFNPLTPLEEVKKASHSHAPEPWEYYLTVDEICQVFDAFLDAYYEKLRLNCHSL